jgi:eukaryotic-like serine/threonine-protein kinase
MGREWDVPGYTGLKVLGSGGFGEVVLARHDASGTLVAIKYLRAQLLADPQFAALFRAEARVLASLDDPNVVRLYEYVESPGGAAIVMELVDGVSLREILSRQGQTTAEAALVVLQGSLLGLAAAHRRGVVHRDYKPENVLVDGAGVSKLTDFGIAARSGDSPVAAGTLAYAPPEQFAGQAASPAADVYAATATFYECLTGRPPFGGGTAELLMRQHMTEPVPLEPVPEPLRPLVEAGLAKDPARRPADGTALVAGLRTAAGQACGPGWEERGRSRLAEAALLLAALWPTGGPAAVHGSTVHRVRLRRHLPHQQISMAKAAIMTGIVIAGAAAGTAVAAAVSRPSSAPAAVTPATARRLPVVDDALGWNQHLTRPSFLGALYSGVPPKAIDGNFVLENLRWPSWGASSAHGTGQIGWAQPGPGGNGISRQAPVMVTLSAVATYGGSRYFSRLAFRFTWHGHTYAGSERFADPCGNTAGCWVSPGTAVI